MRHAAIENLLLDFFICVFSERRLLSAVFYDILLL